MSIRFPGVLGVLALTANSQVLAAEHVQARLEQRAPDGAHCPTGDALAPAIEQRLQRRVFAPDASTALLVRLSYLPDQTNWVAVVELFAPTGHALGQRRITSPGTQCASLSNALPLVIALMLDLTTEDVDERLRAAERQPWSSGQPRSTAPAPPLSRVTLSMTSPMRHSPRARWASVVSLGATAAYRQLPGLGLGARVGIEARSRAFAFELGVATQLTSSVTDESKHRAHFTLYQADLGVCALERRRHAIDFGLCGGLLLGLERATSSGYRLNRSQTTVESAVFAKANSTWWPTPTVGARLSLGLATSLIRDEFYAIRADGSTMTLHRAALFFPYLQAGVCFVL